MGNLNNPITIKEVNIIISKLLGISQSLECFTAEFYQIFKEKLAIITHTLFQKRKKRGDCQT